MEMYLIKETPDIHPLCAFHVSNADNGSDISARHCQLEWNRIAKYLMPSIKIGAVLSRPEESAGKFFNLPLHPYLDRLRSFRHDPQQR